MVVPSPFFVDRKSNVRVLELAVALEKLGHAITIVTYHLGSDIHTEIETKIAVERIPNVFRWYRKVEECISWEKLILDKLLIFKTLQVVWRENPDVVHAHFCEGVVVAATVRKLLFWKKFKIVADLYEDPSKPTVRLGALKRQVVKFGDVAVAGSQENAKQISIIRQQEVTVVPDGVNIERHLGLLSHDQQQHQLELPAGQCVVAYVGSLAEDKGIQYFLEAMPLVLAEMQDVYFVIAGYPMEQVKNFVEEHKLEQHVRLVFSLSYFDLPALLNASDIGVDPRTSDNYQPSRKGLQYMAAGSPVVCFDKENNRRYLGEGAYYSQEISAMGLAKGILHFAQNPQEIESRGELNKRKVVEFSWISSAEQLERIYNRLLSHNGNGKS